MLFAAPWLFCGSSWLDSKPLAELKLALAVANVRQFLNMEAAIRIWRFENLVRKLLLNFMIWDLNNYHSNLTNLSYLVSITFKWKS
jgi:hypothetical protein